MVSPSNAGVVKPKVPVRVARRSAGTKRVKNLRSRDSDGAVLGPRGGLPGEERKDDAVCVIICPPWAAGKPLLVPVGKDKMTVL